MIAPSFWIDPKNGNDYMLTVQYPETQIQNFDDLRAIPIRGSGMSAFRRASTPCPSISRIQSPTEVDHYQLRRVIDIYVQPLGEDLGRIASGDRRNSPRGPRFPTGSPSRCAAWCRACARVSTASASG